jgi:hypothetical protein
MPTHIATTKLATIEKAANRFRAVARFDSTAVAPILAVATASGGAASERDVVMMSLANCSCGATRLSGSEGLVDVSTLG